MTPTQTAPPATTGAFCRESPAVERRAVNGLGRHRWKVERTQSWLMAFRKLDPRYGRRADLHQGFLDLAVALIQWRYVLRQVL
jgi:transposase